MNSAMRSIALTVLIAGLLILGASCSSTHSTHLAYVTVSSGINAFRVDNRSGSATSIFTSPFVVGNSPAGMVIDPSNRFAYVANQLDSTISLVKIDSASGVLTEVLPRTTVGPGTQPGLLAMDAGGKFLFVGDQGSSDITVYSVGSSGALTLVSNGAAPNPTPLGAPPTDLALPASGNFLYVSVPTFSSIYAYSVNSDGSLSPAPGSPFAVANGLSSVAVAPAGNFLYATNPAANTLSGFAVQSTGALQPLASSPFPAVCSSTTGTNCTPVSATVDPSGKFLYVANHAVANLGEYSIDSSTGNLTSLTTASKTAPSAGTNPSFLMFDPNGLYLYVLNSGSNSITELKQNSDGTLSTNSTNTIQVGSVPRALALTR